MIESTKVYVFENWQRGVLDVFVFPRSAIREAATVDVKAMIYRHRAPKNEIVEGHEQRFIGGGEWVLEESGPNEPFTGRPVPSFSLPTEVAEAVFDAVRKANPSRDRDDAVTDARATRDRMFSLVEKCVDDFVKR